MTKKILHSFFLLILLCSNSVFAQSLGLELRERYSGAAGVPPNVLTPKTDADNASTPYLAVAFQLNDTVQFFLGFKSTDSSTTIPANSGATASFNIENTLSNVTILGVFDENYNPSNCANNLNVANNTVNATLVGALSNTSSRCVVVVEAKANSLTSPLGVNSIATLNSNGVATANNPTSLGVTTIVSKPPTSICSSNNLFGVARRGNILLQMDLTTQPATFNPFDSIPTQDSVNGLAVGKSGIFYGVAQYEVTPGVSGHAVYSYNPANRQTNKYSFADSSIPAGTDGDFLSGAIRSDGIYFMAITGAANPDGTVTLPVYAFNTNTNTYIGRVANLIVNLPAGSDPARSARNGDITFDAAGNLYYTTEYTPSSIPVVTPTNKGMLYQFPAPIPMVAATPTPTLNLGKIITTVDGVTPPNGAAFLSDGTLVINSAPSNTGLNKETIVNVHTGAILSQPDFDFGARGLFDLASCHLNGTLSVKTSFATRANPSDDFKVTLNPPTGGGQVYEAQTNASVSEAGTADAISVPGGIYTLTQTRIDNGTNSYSTVYQCIDTLNNNTQVASGSGTSLTYQFPNPSANHAVKCTFVNNSIPSATPFQDSGSSVEGVPRTVINNIRSNDFVDGAVATENNSTFTLGKDGSTVQALTKGISVDNKTGAVNTSAATPAGTYQLTYQLCLQANSTVCNTALITVVVVPPGSANADPSPDTGKVPAGTAGTPVKDVRANDLINGQPATPSNSTIFIGTDSDTKAAIAQGIVINSKTGEVSTTAQTPSGIYTLEYTLCDAADQTVCNITSVNIEVTDTGTSKIAPAMDMGTAVSGVASTPVANVRENDTINNQPATLNNSIIKIESDSSTQSAINQGITLDPATGSVNTTANTAAGVYSMTYALCDISNPAVCQKTTVTIKVSGANNATPVPSLSKYGLLFLAIALGGICYLQIRRRHE
ncbi:hypothetical protein [Comamonas odontotermitis]|uniref:hypothetical protein n=1 Tax=Comamonas odontotermitis TaxID=379895 RepID=UPI001CC7047F|nr:hypothetical protein [Comamonas odontotermitis]UBB16443.1 hypothetical protein LAD35_16785 [Comamonas odontotermitis]